VDTVLKKYQTLRSGLDERGRRLWAAVEAEALGYGGITTVSRATGLAISTIRLGDQELTRVVTRQDAAGIRRIRQLRRGSEAHHGPRPCTVTSFRWVGRTDRLRRPSCPLRWTCKSTRHLAQELTREGHPVSHTQVGHLLKQLGYSLQGTLKTREGGSHPDRDAQFIHLNQQVKTFQQQGQPVISVDAKKKELIGAFAQGGREYQPKRQPEEVEVYDFLSLADGKGTPYRVLRPDHESGLGQRRNEP